MPPDGGWPDMALVYTRAAVIEPSGVEPPEHMSGILAPELVAEDLPGTRERV